MKPSHMALRLGLVLAPLIVMVCLVIAGAGSAWWVYRGNERAITERLASFDRLRSIAVFARTLGAARPEETSKPYAAWYLGIGTPAIMTARLQQRLRQSAAENGVEIVQVSDLAPKQIDRITYLGVRVEMSGPAAGFHRMFAAFETSLPLLFVDGLRMRANAAPDAGDTLLYMDAEFMGAIAVRGGTDIAEVTAP